MARAFDLAAYGYTGPTQTPPPAVEPEPKPTLTIDIGSLLGEVFVEQLRASVQKAAGVEPAPAEEPPAEPVAVVGEPAAEPEPEPEPVPEPVDGWAAAVAHLTQPDPDPWAELVNNLTKPTASSSAATEAA